MQLRRVVPARRRDEAHGPTLPGPRRPLGRVDGVLPHRRGTDAPPGRGQEPHRAAREEPPPRGRPVRVGREGGRRAAARVGRPGQVRPGGLLRERGQGAQGGVGGRRPRAPSDQRGREGREAAAASARAVPPHGLRRLRLGRGPGGMPRGTRQGQRGGRAALPPQPRPGRRRRGRGQAPPDARARRGLHRRLRAEGRRLGRTGGCAPRRRRRRREGEGRKGRRRGRGQAPPEAVHGPRRDGEPLAVPAGLRPERGGVEPPSHRAGPRGRRVYRREPRRGPRRPRRLPPRRPPGPAVPRPGRAGRRRRRGPARRDHRVPEAGTPLLVLQRLRPGERRRDGPELRQSRGGDPPPAQGRGREARQGRRGGRRDGEGGDGKGGGRRGGWRRRNGRRQGGGRRRRGGRGGTDGSGAAPPPTAKDMLVTRLDESVAVALESTSRLASAGPGVVVDASTDAAASEIESAEDRTRRTWLAHHSLDEEGRARCSFSRCRKLFKDTAFLHKHLLKKHSDHLRAEQAKCHDGPMMRAWDGDERRPVPPVLVDCGPRFGLVPSPVVGASDPAAPDPEPDLRREERERAEEAERIRGEREEIERRENEEYQRRREAGAAERRRANFVDPDEMVEEKVELSLEAVVVAPPPKKKRKKKKLL
ncbi:hypothetical protein THAOC_34673 [Thalassiosira oceanica]|uniref:C2H2-type domain-containing protein n=1 Tax=Thalassiosira oceanica TaxID=159749 RepID=K0R4M8_THAOC|nr:hypothetical protein THAOC_34673 [Thalassiosira oceanica]|eukprot:EJK46649.1 hypothetical protein THAOC_34673 [Thalassiosira oceanica]